MVNFKINEELNFPIFISFFFYISNLAELCNIEIVNKHHNDIPFEIQITDQLNGEAIITAKRDLNCEKKRYYHFTMRAISCTGQSSAK